MGCLAGPSIVDDGLVMCLDAGNEKSYNGSGSIWYDLSESENNGILYGPTHIFSSITSFNFDHIDDYVFCGTILNNNSYTKISWFKPLGSSANIMSGNGAAHAFWMGGSTHTLYSGHNGAWTNTVGYRPNPTGDMIGQWWCGATTFNTTDGHKLYLNGELVDTSTSTSPPSGDGAVRVGAHGNSANLFDGEISISKVYNRSISGDEILKNYNALKGRFGL